MCYATKAAAETEMERGFLRLKVNRAQGDVARQNFNKRVTKCYDRFQKATSHADFVYEEKVLK